MVRSSGRNRGAVRFGAVWLVVWALLCVPTVVSANSADRVPAQPTLAGEFVGEGTVDAQGAFVYGVPIGAPATSAGIAPELSFHYSSNAGSSMLGKGWSLAGLSAITRCSPEVAEVIANDDPLPLKAFCLDGVQLKLLNPSADQREYGADGVTYGVERNNAVRVVSAGQCGHGPCSFTVYGPDGSQAVYGALDHVSSHEDGRAYPDYSANSDVQPQIRQSVTAWLLVGSQDRRGNTVEVRYHKRKGALYPAKMLYGGTSGGVAHTHGIEFRYNYDFLTDQFARRYRHTSRGYQNGGVIDAGGILLEEVRTYLQVTGNDFAGARPVNGYSLYYDSFDADAFRSRQHHTRYLESLQMCVYTARAEGDCLEPLTFGWEHGLHDGFSGPHSDPNPSALYRAGLEGTVADWNGLINMVVYLTDGLSISTMTLPIVGEVVGLFDLAVDVVGSLLSFIDLNEQDYAGVQEQGEYVDINGDGVLDFVGNCTDVGQGYCEIFFGEIASDGSLQFQPSGKRVPLLYGVFPRETGSYDVAGNPFDRPRDRHFVDVDGDGFVDLVHRVADAGSGGRANWSNESYLQIEDRFVNPDGTFPPRTDRYYHMQSYRGVWRVDLGDGKGNFVPGHELPGPLDSHDLVPVAGESLNDTTVATAVNQGLGSLVDLNGNGRLDYVRGYCDVLRDSASRLLTGGDDRCGIYLQRQDGSFVDSGFELPAALWGRTQYAVHNSIAEEYDHMWASVNRNIYLYGYGGEGHDLYQHQLVKVVKPTLLGQLIDINGDGYPDYVKRECDPHTESCVWLGTGNEDGSGFFREAPEYRLPMPLQRDGVPHAVFMNINGDAYPDLVQVGDCGLKDLDDWVSGSDPDHYCWVYHGTGQGFVGSGGLEFNPGATWVMLEDFNSDGYLDFHTQKCRGGDSHNQGGCTYLGTGDAETGAEAFTLRRDFPMPVQHFNRHFVHATIVPRFGSIPKFKYNINTYERHGYRIGNFLDLNGDGALDFIDSLCLTDEEKVGDQGVTGRFYRSCRADYDSGAYYSGFAPARIAEVHSRRGNHVTEISYEPLREGGVYRRTLEREDLPQGVRAVRVGGTVVSQITTHIRNQAVDPDHRHDGLHKEGYRYEDLLVARRNGSLGFATRWSINAVNGHGVVVRHYQLEQPRARTIDWGDLGEEHYLHYPLAGLSRAEHAIRPGECASGWPRCPKFNELSFITKSIRRNVFEVVEGLPPATPDAHSPNPDFHQVRIIFTEQFRHGDAGQQLTGTGMSFAYDDRGYPVVVVDHGVLGMGGDQTTIYSHKYHHPSSARWENFPLGTRTYQGQPFGPRRNGGEVTFELPDFGSDPAPTFGGMTLEGAEYTRYGDDGTDIFSSTTHAGLWDGERWQESQSTVDTFGRTVSVTDPLGITTTTRYWHGTLSIQGQSDQTYQTYAIYRAVQDAAGRNGGGRVDYYDQATGAWVQSQDLDHGIRSAQATVIDPLGRPLAGYSTSPAATAHTGLIGPLAVQRYFWDGEIGDYTSEVSQAHGSPSTPDDWRWSIGRGYSDALGRSYLSRAGWSPADGDSPRLQLDPSQDQAVIDPFDFDWIEQRTELFPNGLESRTSNPYRAPIGRASRWTTTHADAYGAIWKVTGPGGVQGYTLRDYNAREMSIERGYSEGSGAGQVVTSEVVHDRQGRVTSHRSNPHTEATRYTYDRQQRRVTATDSAGVVRTSQVDLLGRPRVQDNPDDGRRTFEYNAFGQRSAVVHDGLRTEFEYDSFGRTTVVREVAAQDHPGRITQYYYDGIDPATGSADPDNREAFGRLSEVHYDSGDRDTFIYNRLGQVIESRRYIAALDTEFASLVEYGVGGEVLSETHPDGYRVDYDYDHRMRLERVSGRMPGNNARTLFSHPVYDELDRLVRADHGNGTTVFYQYDEDGRVIHSRHEGGGGELFSQTRHYNALGQLAGVDEQLAGIDPVVVNAPAHTWEVQQRHLSYDYDAYDRLTEVCQSSLPAAAGGHGGGRNGAVDTRRYTYNASGAPVAMDHLREGARNEQRQWIYDSDSPHRIRQLLQVYDDGTHAVRNYQYDERGNVSQILEGLVPEKTLHFDRANRLTRASAPGNSGGALQESLFTYDDGLQRISKTDPDGTQTWNIGGHYEVVRTHNGALLNTRYIRVPGMLVSHGEVDLSGASGGFQHPGSGQPARGYRYHVSDRLGNTRVVADQAGRVRGRMNAAPYGEVTREGQRNYRPGFIGQEEDRRTGLHYLNARYYDPLAHRFLSNDPMNAFDNPYLYTPANPIAYSDPSGMYPTARLLRKLSRAYEGGRLLVVTGLGEKKVVTDAELQLLRKEMGARHLTKMKIVDIRRARDGGAPQVYSWSASAGEFRAKSYENPHDFLADAGLDGTKGRQTLLLFENDTGERLVRADGLRSTNIQFAYHKLYGTKNGRRVYNKAVGDIVDMAPYSEKTSYNAKMLGYYLKRKVYFSKFDRAPLGLTKLDGKRKYFRGIFAKSKNTSNKARALYETFLNRTASGLAVSEKGDNFLRLETERHYIRRHGGRYQFKHSSLLSTSELATGYAPILGLESYSGASVHDSIKMYNRQIRTSLSRQYGGLTDSDLKIRHLGRKRPIWITTRYGRTPGSLIDDLQWERYKREN